MRVDSVPYGEMPSYGDNPTKAMTTQYTYEFSGWNTKAKSRSRSARNALPCPLYSML